jgi:mono/diheme cytochrome c family protein
VAGAGRLGCFGCHGPAGAVGTANPRSFKGYIPPWRGKDFAELVRNEEELKSWIMDGSIPRLRSNAIARFFTKRQVVQMPAYRDALSASELKDIMTYIQWLSQEKP